MEPVSGRVKPVPLKSKVLRILRDPRSNALLLAFMKTEHAEESLLFWCVVLLPCCVVFPLPPSLLSVLCVAMRVLRLCAAWCCVWCVAGVGGGVHACGGVGNLG